MHVDLAAYEAAKASIWERQGEGDTAIVAGDDPVVASHVPRSGPAVVRFGLHGAHNEGGSMDFAVSGDSLVGPDGTVIVNCSELPRDLPHDRRNALAAAATALAAGADANSVRAAIVGFAGLPHRVSLVGETGGVRYYDDSKATAPHATLAATSGFDRVVLVAGGRNKGLDLGELSAAQSVVAAVGIGEAAQEVVRCFPHRPNAVATSMREAVDLAAGLATPGDVVLLSPGCASFDWYSGYPERGDDFAAEVTRLIAQRGHDGDEG